MGLWGLAKGLGKVAGGIITGDGEMIVSGLKKTAINTATTAVQIATNEVWEKAHTDDDEG